MRDSDTGLVPRKLMDVDYTELIGVAAMMLLVIGSTLPEGSMVQRSLFLFGPIVLFGVALVNDEMMLTTLQIVIVVGSLMAFFPETQVTHRLLILTGIAAVSIGYLIHINYRNKDPYWPVGGFGLVLLAIGFAVSNAHLLAFNGLLAVGSLFVAGYAVLGFFVLRVRIQAIWIVLNFAFAITPGMRILRMVT